jgi:hypothetical protein
MPGVMARRPAVARARPAGIAKPIV